MTQYNTPTGAHLGATGGYQGPTQVEVNSVGIYGSRPLDRVRWGPILAGLFAALSLLTLLSVLGMAVGLSAYDPGDRARSFGIGAGVWGGLSMLLAFLLGGWLAGRSAAVRGENNGLLNGAMVWAVAIPLMLYLLAGGVNSIANTASNASSAAATAGQGSQQFQEQVDRVVTASANDPRASGQVSQQDQQQALKTARRSAWGTFISLVLGLAAAATGGWLGGNRRTDDYRQGDRDRMSSGGDVGSTTRPA